MKKPTRLVFFGTEDFSTASLRALVEKGWAIAAVVAKPDTKKGRGQKLTKPAVKLLAQNAGIKVLQPHNFADVSEIIELDADMGVLVAYGKIIPQHVIDIFPHGIINLHPSLLPKYRGPAPIEAAILNGDSQTGLSLMLLSAQMDAGPVFVQQTVELSGKENRLSLSDSLASAGAKLLENSLPSILDASLTPVPQGDAVASYTKLLAKDDGLVDWQKSAQQIEREVRAYLGFPKSRAVIDNVDVILTKTRIAKSKDDGILVQKTGDGWLEILELATANGRTMSGRDFINGYRT